MKKENTKIEVNMKDVINHPEFLDLISLELNKIKTARSTRPMPKLGYRYKRDWYDRMQEKFIFNASFFHKNIENIWYKTSKLSSEERSVILAVCNEAAKKVIQTIIDSKKQKTQPPKTTKKPAVKKTVGVVGKTTKEV